MAVRNQVKGEIIAVYTYRTWLVNFDQSTSGKFLVFGSKEDATEAAKKLLKGPMKGYPYRPKIKEITERLH